MYWGTGKGAIQRDSCFQAIEIDPPDDVEYDVETGINSSTHALMHNFEEERPTSLVASLRESAKSSKRKVKYYCSFVFTPIKKLLTTFKLLIIIGLYSFAGAHLFMYLEVPTDLETKEDGFHQRKIAREVMILNLRAIHYDNREDREERWKHAILKFEADMGLEEPVIDTVWTFWMSFLYAGTIFTTIGYGNIACKTRAGQIATMVYAFAGIPIMLVMLTSLNNFLLKWIKIITNGVCDLLLYTGVRMGLAVIRQDETQKRLRYTKIARKMSEWKITKHGAVSSIAISRSEENQLNTVLNEEEEEMEPDPPVFSTLFATVAWIMLSAAVFCLFEDWTFFTSFYFCFISLTTIGLGDVTPANPEYMIATFGVVIVGLSMLTVCIDVIKEKLALMYMALLQKLLKDYMEAVKNGDPNAASAMMAGFQGKAKYFMPLISKGDGAKVMNKFKEDCSKKGIDPPSVLTNINPETGMPAFANAPREDFNDYIEVAEELFAEEQQRLVAQTPLSKSADFLQAPSRKASESTGIAQMATPIMKVSLEVQAGTTMGKFHDYGSQTQNESSDEGIQTDYSVDLEAEKSKKEPEKIMSDVGTQYEIVILTSIGIQPEVSSIYHGTEFGEHSSGEDEESGCESENEDEFESSEEEESTYKETVLPFEVADPGTVALGLQSPPIQITPFTDDESGTSEAKNSHVKTETAPALAKLTPGKVLKSASMDSTDTVIHVKPGEIAKEKKEKRKRKKKLKTKKTREHELRFLKNSGNQTSPVLLDCATQYEVFTVESGSQYDVKGRSRKCQTKLSSINHEQLQGIRETVQKLRRRESEMSRVTNVSESDWELSSRASESGKEAEEKWAEVSLDLSVIALGVDETGKVVEVPKAVPLLSHPPPSTQSSLSPTSENMEEAKTSASDSTSAEKGHLDSEDEEIESLEELEMYSTDTGAQTEEKVMVDRQEHATPKMLEIMKNCTTQTTFSTFHLPQKVYESASTSSEEEEEEEKKEEAKVQKSKSEVFFMTETGRMEEKEHTEDMPLFLKDSDCQTVELESRTLATSTESLRFAEVQETSEGCSQTELDTNESEMQTLILKYTENTMQTDESTRIEGESQTEIILSEAAAEMETQTEVAISRQMDSQTEDIAQSTAVERQTDEIHKSQSLDHSKPETSSSLCQTDSQSRSEAGVQVLLPVVRAPVECQTDPTAVEAVEVQTDWETCTSDSQTETIAVDSIEIQTETKETLACESQTDSPSVDLQYTQTDEVAFVGDVPVAENGTQSEKTDLVDTETQYMTASFEDRDVQAKPISLHTQTQHSIEIDAKSCQTEIVTTRNRRSQENDEMEEEESEESGKLKLAVLKIDNESQVEVDRSSINLSPIRIDISHSFTMTEPGISEEKEVQVDEESFEDYEFTEKHYSGPLWSDFDYTLVIGEEDEEVMDGETQTEDGSEPDVIGGSREDLLPTNLSSDSLTDEFAVQCTPESWDVKTQTVKFKKRIDEKNVEAKVETSTSTVQATTEMCEQSAGGVGEDDWLQVYVQELDEERRLRMSDIGIQTGVLARVQHMYTRPISDDVNASTSAPITLRKSSDSSEHVSAKTAKSSEESLGPSGTALSTTESMDDHLWAERASPFASRHGSMKRGRSAQDVEKNKDKKAMEKKTMKTKSHGVGVLTSGGDSQGMNSAVRAVVRETLRRGHRCYLIREGFTGLITGKVEQATWGHVANITHIGGSTIGTSRCDEFRTVDGRKKAGKTLFEKRIFHLIVIGGDGSLMGAQKLKDEWARIGEELFAEGNITEEVANEGRELRLAGIVGSIDNDCIDSDKSIGSDTALHRICESIDGLVMTAQSHQRVFVVEVMGRHCGYLALTAAIAVEADYVFYPELPPDDNWPEQLCHQLDSVRKFGKRQNVIILGEGVVNSKGSKIDGKKVKEEVETRLQLEVRIATLGHLQRGGSPTFLDRLLGLRMGYEAVQEVLREKDDDGNPMIGLKNVAKVMCLRGHNIERNELSRVIRHSESAKEETCNGNSEEACQLRGVGFLDKQSYLNFVSVPLTSQMPERSKCFAIIHIGSPCAGMNAATYSFTRMANHSSIQVVGIKNGWDGLKNGDVKMLTWENVQGWAQAGGSLLGAKRQLPSELDKIAEGLNNYNVDGLVIVGGFMAFQSALIFTQTRTEYSCFNIPIVVVPATISNNCPGTCSSLGADTALNEICRQVDNIRQNAIGSKNKVMIIETMGSRSGFLASMTALSTGSEFALIRQMEMTKQDLRKLAAETKQRLDSGTLEKYLLIRSEGASDTISSSKVKSIFDKEMNNNYGVRYTNLGYSQLGGHPSCFDRQMGIRMGVRAFEGCVSPARMGKRDCCVIGLRGSSLRYVPVQGLEKKVCFEHGIPLHLWWLDLYPLVEAMTKKPEHLVAEASAKQT
ncbi:unnamed protein product [Caenorhabditis sp. 36 PRJEB53466]|nr:unnamed protein product [Caenorhabditis sp. 36 PRJEB53466]